MGVRHAAQRGGSQPRGLTNGRPAADLRGRRIAAGFLTGTGWTMVLPQGIVAAMLGQIEGFPPSWFVALHAG